MSINVALLGAGGEGLRERREIAAKLGEKGITALIPEDDLSTDVAASLEERDMLTQADLDLAFISVQSWGSVAEFAEFQADPSIARKLRILVERKHHPLYGVSRGSGYLTDSYLTHDAVFGHVYMYRLQRREDGKEKEEDSPEWIPVTDEIVLKISERFRQWKAFRSK
ncbi:MAG: hypothetical protein ACRD6W_10895 [Nitrososphaerales archaeon]